MTPINKLLQKILAEIRCLKANGGGGNTSGAEQGLSVVNGKIVLGQEAGDATNPAIVTTDRVIPLSAGVGVVFQDETADNIFTRIEPFTIQVANNNNLVSSNITPFYVQNTATTIGSAASISSVGLNGSQPCVELYSDGTTPEAIPEIAMGVGNTGISMSIRQTAERVIVIGTGGGTPAAPVLVIDADETAPKILTVNIQTQHLFFDSSTGSGKINLTLDSVEQLAASAVTSIAGGVGGGAQGITSVGVIDDGVNQVGVFSLTATVFKLAEFGGPDISAIPAQAGMVIYNISTNKLNFYNGSTWEEVTSA